MILPGTLVQYVRNNPLSDLRANGVYTVAKSYFDAPRSCPVSTECDAATLWLCEVDNSPTYIQMGTGINDLPGYCACGFRIIAPPITEADRLEASAPDAPAKPKRVRA